MDDTLSLTFAAVTPAASLQCRAEHGIDRRAGDAADKRGERDAPRPPEDAGNDGDECGASDGSESSGGRHAPGHARSNWREADDRARRSTDERADLGVDAVFRQPRPLSAYAMPHLKTAALQCSS